MDEYKELSRAELEQNYKWASDDAALYKARINAAAHTMRELGVNLMRHDDKLNWVCDYCEAQHELLSYVSHRENCIVRSISKILGAMLDDID